MELKALTTEFRKLIGSDDICTAIRDILFSERKNEVLDQYVKLINEDLETDELQKIFQYYHADRKEKKQDFTPKSIGRLCASITKTDGDVVYDLCAGSGSLTIQKWVQNRHKTFICEELDQNVIPILLFNMSVRNMTGYVINRNALTLDYIKCYGVKSGERFSDIKEVEELPKIEADEIVSNPPYNTKWNPPELLFTDSRFQGKSMPPAANANYAFVLTAIDRLKQGGRCAIVLPYCVLNSDIEKEVRKYLVDKGLVERIIILPGRMFESTSIGVCVMVFSHGNQTIKMYDCRNKTETEQRDQNGQFGGASHEGRQYHKTINVVTDDLIGVLCGGCDDVPCFSKEVTIDDVRKNDYNLTCGHYIDCAIEEKAHRPYVDIMADINRIARERSLIKITCNETLAKQIGLYEVAQLEEKSAGIDLDKTFSLLGGHYERRRFLNLTKSKELKIENQDKEIWSSLISFFIPMWKQHIYFLNQEENRLLVELRDAMLPDLLSGKLQV